MTSTDPYVPTLGALLEPAGAADLFVFRRVAGDRFAHLGGVGRGEGWAGIVEVELDDSALLRDALESGAHVRQDSPGLERVFGPYYARSAIAVPHPPDSVVVLGDPVRVLKDLSPASLRALANAALVAIDHVSPAKRLADELEVLNAIRALSDAPLDSVGAAMAHVAESAVSALSCEVGVLFLSESGLIAIAERGWSLEGGEEIVRDAMASLQAKGDACPLCIQESADNPLPPPFDIGIRSFYLLELADPVGLLLLLHTDANARGFTMLCRELGVRLADVAGEILHRTIAREQLQHQIERLSVESRRDPLTGLANRLAWDEAIGKRQPEIETGRSVSVVVFDVDGLKAANDGRGHRFGDDVLCAVADVLRDCVRDGDVVARIGGDEFAALLHDADEEACAHVVERVDRTLREHRGLDGFRLSVGIGHATCDGTGCLRDATELADKMLLARKSAGRAEQLSV